MKVPFLDLKPQYHGIKDEVMRALSSVCEAQTFVLGPQVREFEEAIEKFIGVSHAVGVASGSDALLLSLVALGVGPGDEVVTTPYTFFATAGSIWRLGARPVFADIDPRTFNISPEKAGGKISPRTKAIIPVHLFGQTADMDTVMATAHAHHIPVIEDAAQAIGAKYKGRPAGTIGDMGCFSFFPSKNLGGFGDGGMVVTPREDFASRIKMLRVHGSEVKYRHDIVGCNSRLDSIQAAVLTVKLRHLAAWEEARRRNAERYRRLFRDHGLGEIIGLPTAADGNTHVYNQFVIRVPKRDDLKAHLQTLGIGTEVYYPIPLHLQPCFAALGYREGDLPESERAARESLALPIYPELTEEMQGAVVEAISGFFSSR